MSLPELKIEEARIQDGTINNPTDFWQLVMDTGYIMEGENRDFEREQLHWLNNCLRKYFDDHPEVKVDSDDLEHFAMHAVERLVGAFTFNDMPRNTDWAAVGQVLAAAGVDGQVIVKTNEDLICSKCGNKLIYPFNVMATNGEHTCSECCDPLTKSQLYAAAGVPKEKH